MEPDPTAAYFEAHPTDYDPDRFVTALEWIGERAGKGASLIDVGCGTGNVLAAIAERIPVSRLAGCDVSDAALKVARSRVEFEAHRGSVLDEGFVSSIPGEFDIVVLGAVLHHLIGGSRRSSRSLALTALHNAAALAAPRGSLVVVEPTYAPRAAMTAVFWAKRVVTAFTSERVELGRWNNLGAPVVSYYAPRTLEILVGEGGWRVARAEHRPARLRRVPRMLGVRGRWDSTVLAIRDGR